jgi:hypothetical protein
MAYFNRVVTTLLLLALIPVVTIALIAPREAIQVLIDVLDQIESQFDPSPSALQMLLRVGLALAVDAFLVLLVYLQLRRSPESRVRVWQVEGGEAQIAVDSVVSRLGYQIDRLPGVLDVTPTVTPRRRGVEVVLDIEMAAGSNIPANIEEISAVTRSVIEDDMGLKLKGKPKINLRTVEYPEVDAQIPAFKAVDDTPSTERPVRSDDEDSALDHAEREPKVGEGDEPGDTATPS